MTQRAIRAAALAAVATVAGLSLLHRTAAQTAPAATAPAPRPNEVSRGRSSLDWVQGFYGRVPEPTLSFQTGAAWHPRLNVEADVAMVYGVTPTTKARMKSWSDHGYRINLMTGVAWGEYQDYLFGRFDGHNHEDEAQTTKAGKRLGHGKDVYYMSPGPTYGAYLSSLVKTAIDDGAEAIYLEEPEFWSAAGYEPHFKVEWEQYYHEPWQDPEGSADAQYRSSKLKYYLYRRALADVFRFVREYGNGKGKDIKCYVATHSLINYADWGIVSPESSLLDVGCGGYIAQVWTGTSRSENFMDGARAERTFETAFLEYGQMQNLVRASGRDMWFLNDPVEDNPRHTWSDYRFNWECTLTASLLQPEVYKFETMPWPERIFRGYYPVEAGDEKKVAHYGISREYGTELQSVIGALGDMKQPASAVHWDRRGTPGVGVLVSDTLMFERQGPGKSDSELGQFFGLALPLVDRGVPVEPAQLEDADLPGFLSHYRMLLLTYEGQKPVRPHLHVALADWVRAGGTLVVVDDDKDPANAVREWWNEKIAEAAWHHPDGHDATPRLHLFRQLGIPEGATGPQSVGKGVVLYQPESPNRLSRTKGGAQRVRDLCATAAKAGGIDWTESPAFVLHRGPYVVAATLAGDGKPLTLTGRFIPLFDPTLPVVQAITMDPNQRQLLVDLDVLPKDHPVVAAASCAVRDERWAGQTLTFTCTGQEQTQANVRVLCGDRPRSVTISGQAFKNQGYTYDGGVLKLGFPNAVTPVAVKVEW